jgi:hypothetical protein
MDAVNAWTLGLFFPGSLVTSRWDQCLVPPIPQWALFLDDMGTCVGRDGVVVVGGGIDK